MNEFISDTYLKFIKIKMCSQCPHFVEFPADFFDGDCAHKNASDKTTDSRIIHKGNIPEWCPL